MFIIHVIIICCTFPCPEYKEEWYEHYKFCVNRSMTSTCYCMFFKSESIKVWMTSYICTCCFYLYSNTTRTTTPRTISFTSLSILIWKTYSNKFTSWYVWHHKTICAKIIMFISFFFIQFDLLVESESQSHME